MLATRRAGSIRHKAQDAWLFLSRWAKAPGRMGAVAPSSRALALAMAAEIPASDHDAPVIELGGGTGSITSGLLESGIAPSRLVVIERDRHLAALLRQRFKGVLVICGDAGQLPELLARHGITRVAAVVSGLPLLLFPADLLERIVHGCFNFCFWQKIDDILGTAIQLGMPFLTTETFHLSHSNSLHTHF